METDIDRIASNVVQLLQSVKKHAATAESCTGGMVSGAVTSVSGASEVFDIGLCTYANWAKHKFLRVSEETLNVHGAVSGECALEMALGVKLLAHSDYGVSTTGIAGPSGGTDEKPVGTVFIAAAGLGGYTVRLFKFSADGCPSGISQRDFIRLQAVKQALLMLKNEILSDSGDKCETAAVEGTVVKAARYPETFGKKDGII